MRPRWGSRPPFTNRLGPPSTVVHTVLPFFLIFTIVYHGHASQLICWLQAFSHIPQQTLTVTLRHFANNKAIPCGCRWPWMNAKPCFDPFPCMHSPVRYSILSMSTTVRQVCFGPNHCQARTVRIVNPVPFGITTCTPPFGLCYRSIRPVAGFMETHAETGPVSSWQMRTL
jgi:hypothetical protein